MAIFELNATLLAELAVFVIVVVVVAKVVLPPLRKAIAERQAVILKGLADAEAAEVRLVEAETEYRRQLDLARREGKEILYAYRGMAATMGRYSPTGGT